MQIKIVTNQKEWDDWLIGQSQVSFTQSWDWGEILKNEGKKIERIQFVDGAKICGAALLTHNEALGFEYYFCPKGPVIKSNSEVVLKALGEHIKEKNGSFVRLEPASKNELEGKRQFKKTIDINPRATIILELQQTEAELLEKMHSKSRYNVRLAEKKNLEIANGINFEDSWRLIEETRRRDGFHLHERKHYEEILKSKMVKQLTAKVDGKAIAVAIFVSFGDTATYLFGASDYEHRNLMAPYLLQWQGIKESKAAGSHYYDFFGIAPRRVGFSGTEYEYDNDHQYAGVTRFKLGFGGKVIELPGTYDLIVSETKYKMYEALRKIRRLI